MASSMIGRRRPKDNSSSVKKDKATEKSSTKCPIFTVQYLGKLPSRGEYGREYISEPVECLMKLRERQRLPKTTLTVSEKGFHFLDNDGPFGKEKHVLIPLHNICYGVADEQNPRVFALITRTDSNPDSSLFECHAFLCDKKKTSSDITYWLLRTFLQVFEELQNRRRLRQERRLLRRQQNELATADGRPLPAEDTSHRRHRGKEHPSRATSVSSLDKPFQGKPFSLILEGSKERGASVRVALSKEKEPSPTRTQRDSSHDTAKNEISRLPTPDYNGNLEHGSSIGELISFTADVHPTHHTKAHQGGRNSNVLRNPHVQGDRKTYVYSGGGRPPMDPRQSPHDRSPHPQNSRRTSTGRYTKNVTHSTNSSGSRGTESIPNRSTIPDESDYLFIDLLQEEFTDAGGRSRLSVLGRKSGNSVGPPNQTLRSEDIERRIYEWLSAREDSYDDEISVFGSEGKSPSPRMNYRRQWSSGDTISVTSGDSYF